VGLCRERQENPLFASHQTRCHPPRVTK
jgi:hypothetical protein